MGMGVAGNRSGNGRDARTSPGSRSSSRECQEYGERRRQASAIRSTRERIKARPSDAAVRLTGVETQHSVPRYYAAAPAFLGSAVAKMLPSLFVAGSGGAEV